MSRFNWIEINKNLVLRQDFSGLPLEELAAIMDQCHKEVKNKNRKDLIIVTNIENLKFDRHVTHHFQELMAKNKPYVKASCIYGVGALQKVTIETVAKLTGRTVNVFKTESEALKWLEQM